jgi:molecular chaperone IbpA
MNQLFDITKFAIGFDEMMDRLHHQQNQTVSYPPYNIHKISDFDYEIQMALAGFSKNDIDIELADSILTISSNKENNKNDNSEIYRGISYRKFKRQFTIAEDIEVKDTKLENGLLVILLEKIIPEEKKPKIIKVK